VGELEKRSVPIPVDEPKFYEGSWVGQFRAINDEQARLFGQAVRRAMEEMGVQDVGVAVRLGSVREFAADEGARINFIEDVPHGVIHESVTHEELQRQLKAARERTGDGD